MSVNAMPDTNTPTSLGGRSSTSEPNRGVRRWIVRGIVLSLLVGLGGGGFYAVSGALGNKNDGPQLTHTIRRGDVIVSVVEQGTLESSNNHEIKCRVGGWNTVTWIVEGGTIVEEGDELVRLDTKVIEENLSLQKTNVHTAEATLARSKADAEKAEIAIEAYLDGEYQFQKQNLERQIIIAKRNFETAKKLYSDSEKLFLKGYVTDLEVAGNKFSVTQAELELGVAERQLHVLETYTKEMRLERLRGDLVASRSKMQADEAGLKTDTSRRDRAQQELSDCVIRADRSGMVIYPSAAAWKDSPDVDVGARVRKDQVLLLMPDLGKMQVKVGIHESVIERLAPGLDARVSMPDQTIEAKVSKVSSVTRPAGWWTGNVVKYDTIIELNESDGLKPGMSAEVEVILAVHRDVLMVPVSAVVETIDGDYCWVKTPEGPKRRQVSLGDTNDVFLVVEAGLKEGDEVVLNPMAFVEEAQSAVLKPTEEETPVDQVEKVSPKAATNKNTDEKRESADDQ